MMTPPPELDPVDYVEVTRTAYSALGYTPYAWAHNPDPVDLVALAKPVSESKVVLIASGGVYRVGDIGFTHKDDLTHREIPADTLTSDIRVTHFAYDTGGAESDPNAVFPIDALRAMVAEGEIGSIADVALTFMGGIYSQRRVLEQLSPRLVERVHELEADIALLVPV